LVDKEKEFGDKFITQYLKYFYEYSMKNKDYGLLILHVLIGQALKHVYFREGARKIDIRMHGLFISPSGTGKGAGFGLFCKLATDLGLDNQQLTEATDAGLAGTGIRLPDGNYELIPGLMETADFISMEEASPIFDMQSQFSKKNLTYLQQAMNPLDDASCEISKRLGSMIDAIRFKPHCSALLTTYIPDHFKEDLVKRGVMQRFTMVMKNPSLEDRMKIIYNAIDKLNAKTEEHYEKEYQELLTSFKTIINEFQKLGGLEEEDTKKYQVEDDKLHRIVGRIAPTLDKKQQESLCKKIHSEVSKLQKPVWKGFCFDIDDKVKVELKVDMYELVEMIKDTTVIAQEKLAEFVHRIYEILVRLAIHHSIIRMDRCVRSNDVLYAKKIFTPIWKELIYNIEELLVPTSTQMVKTTFIIHRSIDTYKRLIKENDKRYVKKKEWVRRTKLLQDLQFVWNNCSRVTANNRLLELETEKEGDTNKNKWFLKNKINNIVCVRLIQDIM